MSYCSRRFWVNTAATLAIVCLPIADARAAFHRWDFSEIFSNEDGSVQFIELLSQFSGENFVANHFLRSDANSFKLLTNLLPTNRSTANRRFIFATAAFAELPGAVTPDYVIPDSFFDPHGDTLDWDGFDSLPFIDGQLPLDGFHSLLKNGTTAVNTPTNFADQVGEINLAPPDVPGDTNGDRLVDLVDLNNVRNNFGSTGEGVVGDTNDDQLVDLVDLNAVRNNFGAAGGSPVPEPAGIALGFVGALALAIAKRKRA